jgi:hypothetical protein
VNESITLRLTVLQRLINNAPMDYSYAAIWHLIAIKLWRAVIKKELC